MAKIDFEDIFAEDINTTKKDVDINFEDIFAEDISPVSKQKENVNFNNVFKEDVKAIDSDLSNIANKDDKFDNSIGSWFDRLARGQYASANLARGLIKDYKEMTPEQRISKRKKYTTPFINNVEFAKDLWRNRDKIISGLSGKEKGEFVDVLSDLGWEDSESVGFNFLKEVVGTGLNITLDPSTYLAGPAIRGFGKGLKFAGQATAKIPAVASGLEKTTDLVKPVLEASKRLFKRTTGIKELDELVEKKLTYNDALKDRAIQFGTKTGKDIKNIAKKTGKTVDELNTQVVNIIERPDKFSSDIPELQKTADNLKNYFSNLLTKEMKAGVPITELSSPTNNIQYFPRITTKEAKTFLNASKKKGTGNYSKTWNKNIQNAKERLTKDFTLNEFNDFVSFNGLKSLGGNQVEQFFMKNPAYASATRGLRSSKAVSSAEFLDEAGKSFGFTKKKSPSFYVELSESTQKANPSLKGKFFDPIVAGEINNTYSKFFNPDEVNKVFQIYDKIHNAWKGWTTAVFPSFHVRNAVGNLWNNYLAGVKNPKRYTDAMKLQNLRKSGNLNKVQKELIENAEDLGVLGKGWYGADIPQAIESQISSPKLFSVGDRSALMKGARGAGTAIENNARLAHYLDKVGKGFSQEDAAKSVKKFLFDYSDLSEFEKNIMKRMFPFYTFTRKNLPLQFEQAIKNPQKFLGLEKIRKGLSRKEEVDYEFLPEWMKESYPIKVGKIKNKNNKPVAVYMRGQGLIPAADVLQIFRPQEIAIEQMSPMPKGLLEFAINKDFFTEREISSFKGDDRRFLGMIIPSRFKKLLRNFRVLNEIDRGFFRNVKDIDTGLSIGEKIFGIMGPAKITKIDLDNAKSWYRFNIKKEFDTARKAAASAYRNGDEKLGDTLVKNANKIIENIKNFDEKYGESLVPIDKELKKNISNQRQNKFALSIKSNIDDEVTNKIKRKLAKIS